MTPSTVGSCLTGRERWPSAHPVQLIYAESGNLVAQGQAWHRALTAAGVENELVTVPGADHVFSSAPAQRRLHKAVAGWLERHR